VELSRTAPVLLARAYVDAMIGDASLVPPTTNHPVVPW
jgi:hypothetical protein